MTPEIERAPEPAKVVPIASAAQMELAYAIRRRVFIEEQGVPDEIERDEDDALAFHVLAIDGDKALGCGRMVTRGDSVKIGRMAVEREYRSRGIGKLVIEFLMDEARRRGIRRAVLHAQVTAEGFYAKMRFLPVGPVFDEAGIPHRRMERDL